MKKWLLILILGLALTGCGQEAEESTEGDAPVAEKGAEQVEEQTTTSEPTAEPTAEPTPEATAEPIPEPTPEPAPESTLEPTPEPVSEEEDTPGFTLNLELQETDNPRIMEILNVSETYTDSIDNTYYFSYRIPQFHAESENAKTVNQRIVDDILPYVEDEFETMELDCSLNHIHIGYQVFECGDIVSILVTIPYDNDVRDYYTYSYDFENENEVTNAELLALRGMTEESFVETACKMEEEYWNGMLSSIPENSEDRDWFEETLNETKAITTPDLPMYLDEDGTLKVYIPFPSLAGASWYYDLCDF